MFYRDARFFSPSEVAELVQGAGFGAPTWLQTLVGSLESTHRIERARRGFGSGAFVVARATRAPS